MGKAVEDEMVSREGGDREYVRRAHTLDSVGILFKEILQYYSRFCPRKTSGTYSRDIAL